MASTIKTFMRKDLVDIYIGAHDLVTRMDQDCEESWPHRIQEIKALVQDLEQWAIRLHGGEGLYRLAAEDLRPLDDVRG